MSYHFFIFICTLFAQAVVLRIICSTGEWRVLPAARSSFAFAD